MDAVDFSQRLQHDLLLSGGPYQLTVKVATVALLCAIALTDLRTFKIQNASTVLLFALYVLYAIGVRSWQEVVANLVLGVAVFSVLLLFYRRGVIGGGDVKLLPVACLWIGTRCVLVFAALLLLLIGLHLLAVKFGWVRTKTMLDRPAIAYAPSIAGALIGSILLGCV
jgi:Flp pilus assembly protein protease CpaA